MARLGLTYNWNGEPHTYQYAQEFSTIEVQLMIHQIWGDGFAKIPTEGVSIDTECPRSIYIIPIHQILRLHVQLDADEECPDIEV
jgi:hypothetical protein